MQITFDTNTRMLALHKEGNLIHTSFAGDDEHAYLLGIALSLAGGAIDNLTHQAKLPATPRAHGCTPIELDRFLDQRPIIA